MMRIIVPLCAALCFFVTQANADFTFPPVLGPINVMAGTGSNINFNDALNSAGVTADAYSSFELMVDWTAGGGNPWSNEALFSLTSGGTVGPLSASAGAAGNGNPTQLTFSGNLPSTYDPSVNGTLDVFINQSFDGSDANWNNLSLTLFSGVIDPPTTEATLTTPPIFDSTSYADVAYGAGEITWVLFQHDGQTRDIIIDTESTLLSGDNDTEIGVFDAQGILIGSNDDGGTGFLSSITFTDLAAGDYYIAATAWNGAFSDGWNVSTTGTATGSLVVNISAIPEPSSMALIGLFGLGLAYRRSR